MNAAMSTPLPEAYSLWALADSSAPRLVGALRKLSNGDVSLHYADSWIAHGYAIAGHS